MCCSWAKVHSFLDSMNIQELHSALPSSISSFSHSPSSSSGLQPLSIDARRWDVGERTARQILSFIQPNEDSEDRRKEIIAYLQMLIEENIGLAVFPFGSVPLKTYLPHGDIDLTVINHYSSSEDLATGICNILEHEERNNTNVQVKDVLCVPAQVRIVKCTVDGICIDISFNQKAGLGALYFLEKVDRLIGKDHLFKRSVILIKAWCYYESRILGGFHGLISTYALEIMVLHVVNLFHSSLQCPLAVLYKFLEYYSTFDWNRYGVGINGLVLLSSLPTINVKPPSECDDLLLTDTFLRNAKEEVLSSMGVVGHNAASFSVKFMNILDPLRDDNNLGRSVGKGNFFRIKSALSYGAEKLGVIMMLPLENIKNELEKFFKDTIERNGKGRRADTAVPVLTYGSEMSYDNSGSDQLLSGVNYIMWFNDCGVMYPVTLLAPENHQYWNNGWADAGHNAWFDQNMYNNFNKSPRSFDGVTSFATSNAAPVKAKFKPKGTGTFFPHMNQNHPHQRNMMWKRSEQSEVEHLNRRICVNLKENEIGKQNQIGKQNEIGKENEIGKQNEIGKENEIEREVETADYPDCTSRDVNPCPDEAEIIDKFSFSIEEFPVLPGSKPIPIKVNPLFGCPEPTLVVKEPSASLDNSLELDSFKHSSPRSLVSEVGKQSVSDATVIVDLVGDPTPVTVPEDQELSKSEEKLVVPEEPLQLADDMEFPPLSRPPEPVIVLNKKEFPPLRSCLKSHKKPKWKKDSK